MYIAYNTKTKRVIDTSEKPFIFNNENIAVAEATEIPSNYDFLIVDNVKERTRVVQEAYTEEVIEWNEETQQEETKLVEYPQVTETYYACDLIPKFRSEEELAKQRAKAKIIRLKEELCKTDYQAIKFAEGWLTEEEYAPIKAQRQAYREEINQLEGVAK